MLRGEFDWIVMEIALAVVRPSHVPVGCLRTNHAVASRQESPSQGAKVRPAATWTCGSAFLLETLAISSGTLYVPPVGSLPKEMDLNSLNTPLGRPEASFSRSRAILALVVVNAMWGASFPVMKCLNLEVDEHFGVTEFTASTALRTGSAAWMIAIRFAVALGLFLIFFRGTLARVRRAHVLAGVAIGTLFFIGLLCQVIGLATIPASRSGFLTSLAVVFTPLLSTLGRRRLPHATVLLGAAVALAGVSILTGLVTFESGRLSVAQDALSKWTTGDSLTTLAAFSFSGQILLVDRLGKRYDSVAFTPSMFAVVAVLASIVFAMLSGQIPEDTASFRDDWMALATQPRFYWMIGLLCVFPSLLAFAWMNKYQPTLTAVQAAVIYTLEPVFASLWAMFLPAVLSITCAVTYGNEEFSMPLVIGGGLVLMANVLALWPEPTQ